MCGPSESESGGSYATIDEAVFGVDVAKSDLPTGDAIQVFVSRKGSRLSYLVTRAGIFIVVPDGLIRSNDFNTVAELVASPDFVELSAYPVPQPSDDDDVVEHNDLTTVQGMRSELDAVLEANGITDANDRNLTILAANDVAKIFNTIGPIYAPELSRDYGENHTGASWTAAVLELVWAASDYAATNAGVDINSSFTAVVDAARTEVIEVLSGNLFNALRSAPADA